MDNDNIDILSSEEASDPFEGLSEEEISELLEAFVDDIFEKLDELSDLFFQLEEIADKERTINSILQIFHGIKGTGGTFGFHVVSTLAHNFESVFTRYLENTDLITPEFVSKLLKSLEIFKRLTVNIKKQSPVLEEKEQLFALLASLENVHEKDTIIELDYDPGDHVSGETEILRDNEYIKLKSTKIDTMVNLTGEMILRKHFDDIQNDKLIKILKSLKILKSSLEHGNERIAGTDMTKEQLNAEYSKNFKNLNLSIEKIEKELQNLSSENRVWTEETNKLISNLHNEALNARMIAINEFFRRIKRSVRNIAEKTGKKVRVAFQGENTELDRMIIEEIKDPVIHLIRNAIDHGIEEPRKRLAAGKRESGTIKIVARPAGNEVVLEIEDDGSGIDIKKVRQTALKNGLYTDEILSNMDEPDIISIIFQKGFTTKNQLSQISGRGIGLDIVKSKIENINGVISVDSKKGLGTRFSLTIPISLASIQAVFCRVSTFYFFIPSIAIEKVMQINPEIASPVEDIDAVKVGKELIPYAYLGKYFSIENNAQIDQRRYFVILSVGNKKTAVEIDECFDLRNIIIKPGADIVRNSAYVSGISILSDGNLAYVLDPSGIIEHSNKVKSEKGIRNIWDLSDKTGDTPSNLVWSENSDDEENQTETSEKVFLRFSNAEDNYGIPVDSVDKVCNINDEKIARQLEGSFDTVLFVSGRKAWLKERNEIETPGLISGEKKPEAVVKLKIHGHSSILIPDKINSISVIDESAVLPVVKEGEYKSLIPDLVRIEKN